MNRKALILSVIAFVGVSLGVSLVVGNNTNNDSNMGMNHGAHSMSMGGDEAMFLQMMIPHHQQAIVISDLAISISKNEDILKLANQIKGAQAPEIDQMKSWLKAAGLGEDPGHSMHAMAGMLTDSQLEQLKNSTGKDFDRQFLSGMIAHHQGAVEMVRMIENSSDLKLRDFGEQINQSQSSEIAVMKQLLKSIG
ncbi:MAG TPA: DUF305 domain-containing protein [Candidatus Nanopelagicus sp.]|nr:DUF305 domain-containing protein [Candidatus Nanopelagicus sp.]